jgi:hypothetical protein
VEKSFNRLYGGEILSRSTSLAALHGICMILALTYQVNFLIKNFLPRLAYTKFRESKKIPNKNKVGNTNDQIAR